MIVVDANVIAYLLIPGSQTPRAEALLESDPQWVCPRLWRSEIRHILATYVRTGQMTLVDSIALFQRAELLIGSHEYEPETHEVLRLSAQSRCSAYDCEYIALARYLGLVLVTADAKLRKAFPTETVAL